MSLSTSIATGGLAAAAIAGWQQIKSVFSYISGFVLIRAEFDPSLNVAVMSHVKRNYRRLPSGLYHYASLWLNLIGDKQHSIVPFRVSPPKAVYVRGRQVLFVSHTNSRLSISTIRGSVNLDSLVADAVEFSRHQREYKAPDNRFYIHKFVGMDKSNHSSFRNQQNSNVPPPTGDPQVGTGSSTVMMADYTVDTSFAYPRFMYEHAEANDPLNGLYFDDDVLSNFEHAKKWLTMGDWYLERDIPWRRGWLLEGPGGTGKSSLARAVAETLKIPIYTFYLATMSDQEFMEFWSQMNMPCMVLFEEFDTVFNLRESLTEHKSLTFDCVLNQISGVDSKNGVFLVITTNHMERIDKAMGVSVEGSSVSTRPGRIDRVIHIGPISKKNQRLMATHILRDWPEEIDQVVANAPDGVTPIQFQELCLQVAYRLLTDDPTPKLCTA